MLAMHKPAIAMAVAIWGAALLSTALPAQAQEEATIKRATALRSSPGDNASSVAELAASATVTRTSQRQGAWIQVRAASGAVGWVHMFDVGAPTRDNAAVSGMRAVGGLVGSPGAVTIATNTVGIRGLGEGDVSRTTGGGRAAGASNEALRKLDETRVAPDEARAFATASALQPRNVEALPVPPPPVVPAPAPARAPARTPATEPGNPYGNQ